MVGTQLSSPFVLKHSPKTTLQDTSMMSIASVRGGNQVPFDNVPNLESEGTCQLWGYSCPSFPRVLCRGKLDCQ